MPSYGADFFFVFWSGVTFPSVALDKILFIGGLDFGSNDN